MLKVVYEEKVPVAVVVLDSQEVAEDTIKDLKSHGVTVIYRQITVTPDNARKALELILLLLQEWMKEEIFQSII